MYITKGITNAYATENSTLFKFLSSCFIFPKIAWKEKFFDTPEPRRISNLLLLSTIKFRVRKFDFKLAISIKHLKTTKIFVVKRIYMSYNNSF